MGFPKVTFNPEISLSSIIALVCTFATVIWVIATIQADVNINTAARQQGILPEAERRVTALETAFGLQIKNLTDAINMLREQVEHLRVDQYRKTQLTEPPQK